MHAVLGRTSHTGHVYGLRIWRCLTKWTARAYLSPDRQSVPLVQDERLESTDAGREGLNRLEKLGVVLEERESRALRHTTFKRSLRQEYQVISLDANRQTIGAAEDLGG